MRTAVEEAFVERNFSDAAVVDTVFSVAVAVGVGVAAAFAVVADRVPVPAVPAVAALFAADVPAHAADVAPDTLPISPPRRATPPR